MTTLIKDLIDIPERVQRTDFVLNLTYGLAPEAVERVAQRVAQCSSGTDHVFQNRAHAGKGGLSLRCASVLLRSIGADQRRSPLAGDLIGEPSSAETREQLARRRLVSRCPA
jgi:hypothetical protein